MNYNNSITNNQNKDHKLLYEAIFLVLVGNECTFTFK